MKIIKFSISILIIAILSISVAAYYPIYLIDTPMHHSINKGELAILSGFYSGGGISLKLMGGFTDFLSIGFCQISDQFIGNGNIKMYSPAPIIKINILKGGDERIGMSIGYDSASSSMFLRYNGEPVYGAYINISKPFYFGEYENFIVIGWFYPTMPYKYANSKNSFLFGGFNFYLLDYLMFRFECSNIKFIKDFVNEAILSGGASLIFTENLSINLILRYSNSNIERALSIDYIASF